MKNKPRSLMDCLNAIYPNEVDHMYVWCSKGHKLGTKEQVDRGDRLLCRICQPCKDFEPFDTEEE